MMGILFRLKKGGLDPATTEEMLYAAFIPFGDISAVSIPKDYRDGMLVLHVFMLSVMRSCKV